MDSVFSIKVRVYYEDTDAGGIVYNANYVKFIERARTEWLRSFNIQQDDLLKDKIAFVVRKININFKKAARFNQLLTVTCSIKKAGMASLTFYQQIFDENGVELVDAEVSIACVNIDEMKPILIPEFIKEVITCGN